MAEKVIVGRKKEIEILDHIRKSKTAEFLAIYGRRRVGKTFLIREYFSNKGFYLETAGVKDLPLTMQLTNFASALSKTFFEGIPIQTPTSWNQAFEILTQKMQSIQKNKKIIIFLDELPWLAAKKSGLVPALDYFWNLHWSRIPNLILIVCGSAASWMLEYIVNAKGGLYNRITKKIPLEPFTLQETQTFLKANNINFTQKQVLDLYMVLGGIPFYLKEAKKGKSTTQIIDDLCFQKNGILYSEFNNVFRSLFDHAETHLQIIREIANRGNVISREQLIAATKFSSGGTLNKRLDELEASGFIKTFVPLGKKLRDRFYRIIDEYALFYLKWIDPLIHSETFSGENEYWNKLSKTAQKMTWAGYAFENICFKHLKQIVRTLGIKNISYKSGSWRYLPSNKSSETGSQIDLLFDREDGVISICEIKYSDHAFIIDKSYAKVLLQKIENLAKNYPNRKNPTNKQIFLSMVTIYGLKPNMYCEDLVHNEVTLEHLFS